MAPVLIIGAGPTGLAVSHVLQDAALVVEAEAEVGGLCRSIAFGGGVFDIGGHSFHTPYPKIAALIERLMAGRWTVQRRDARVLHAGQVIDYPFQQHFDQLDDPGIVAACRASEPDAGAAERAENLEDWLLARFGAGVAAQFMLPYNRKLWARDLTRVGRDWVGERIVGAERAGQAGRTPLSDASRVGYPADGGFSEIFRSLAAECGPIRTGVTVAAIDPVARTVTTTAGETLSWRRLVSTIPLPRLLEAIQGCPTELTEAAARLECVSLKILMMLVDGPVGAAPQRVYSAEADLLPHKIAFNHTASPALRARPTHAVMCEIAYSPFKPAPDDETLTQRTLDGLANAGLLSADKVLETRILDVPFGYPVYTPERDAIVRRADAWLRPLGIHSAGRFGAWAYVNSDRCLHDGLELGRVLQAELAQA